MPADRRQLADLTRIFFVLTAFSLIAACGGGGGGAPAPALPSLSSDASLSSLAAAGATLDPAFSTTVTSYSASVSNSTSSVDISAATTDNNARLTINGGNNVTVALAVGENAITVDVTAENGSNTRTYTITITREPAQASNVTVDPDRVVLFEADRRSVTATIRDANGTILTGRTVTWSSLDSAVATVSTAGEIIAVSVGTTTIRAMVEGQQGDTLVTVTPPISTYEDYKAHFPYQETSGQFVVSSDFSAAFSQQHLEHLMKAWQYFSALYAGSAGTYTEMYYTRDLTGLYTRIIATCPTTIVVGGRNLTACFDSQNGVYIWFVVPYIEPDFGTQLHEIGHSFLYFTQFDSANWPWFNEGISMYWESGSFDANGSYSVTAPLPYLISHFRRISNANALVSLPTLFQLTRNQFYGDPDPAKLYSQAGMLLYYLFKQYPAVAQAVIDSINNGQIANNNAVIDYILQQTGLTIAELETNYTQYALQF